MSLTNDQVKKIAKLARIRLDDGEIGHYASEINNILSWIEQLQEVNTDNVIPLTSVSHEALPWREDVVRDGHKQSDILANATDAQFGCFAVPKVIE
jgi:aspartyl-tRNA(Asn)/glutamyl-tRNA(Gln) amidotransferase subunit C